MNRRTFVSAALCPLGPLGHLAPPNDPLIASLDLARPELAMVKAAADAGDISGARREFAAHLRKRTASPLPPGSC